MRVGGELVALELDPVRAARARAAGLSVQEGDLETLPALGPAAFVRVANVLRGLDLGIALSAHLRICASLGPGGLALEGSTDRHGAFAVAHELRPEAPQRRALIFAADLSAGFAPPALRHVLPRDLRGRAREGALGRFFGRWEAAFAAARAAAPRASADALWSQSTPAEETVMHLPMEGGVALRWAPAGGVPGGGDIKEP